VAEWFTNNWMFTDEWMLPIMKALKHSSTKFATDILTISRAVIVQENEIDNFVKAITIVASSPISSIILECINSNGK
jgi:hypothetical protein